MPPSDGQGASSTARRRLVSAALAVALGLGGASMIGYALEHQETAPQPAGSPAALAPQPAGSPAALAPSSASGPLRPAALPASTPTSIRIPAIKVSSPVNSVGLNLDNTMEVPPPGPRYNQAAWYRYSPTPGEIGPSVIIGHIDSAKEGPSVFYKLGALKPGHRIEIDRADGTTVAFDVESVQSAPKQMFPTNGVYGATDYAALRLITCGGTFDRATGNYRDNIVVFARLHPPVPA